MVIKSTFKGEGEVDVHVLVDPIESETEVLCEMVGVVMSIIENIPNVTHDKKAVGIVVDEILTAFEGVLDDC